MLDLGACLLLVARIVSYPLAYTALVAIAFTCFERLAPLRAPPRTPRSLRCDALFATIGAVLTEALLVLVASRALALVDEAATALGLGASRGPLALLPTWLGLPLGLLLVELGGYAYHRLAHRVPILWRLHAVHHGADALDWLASFRQHPLEIALMTTAQNLPLVVLGMPAGPLALVAILLRLHTVFVHANLRTPGWLGALVGTPHFHHRHHDRSAPDANYASLLPALDWLFGTYDATPPATPGLVRGHHRFLSLLLARAA